MESPLTTVMPANAAAVRAEAPPGPLMRLQTLPTRAKAMLGLGAAGLLAVAVALVLWGQQASYATLYAGLAEKDAGAVATQLEQMGIAYRLSGAGSIMVPTDQVLPLRMKLAQQNLPRGTTSGNELLDANQFGQSPTKERSTQIRALQGELERSIMTLDAVQSARVHLSVPPTTAFFQDQPKPSASVVLALHGGRTLDRSQVAGIVFLVVRAVAGMNAKDVSVIDQRGALLSETPDNAGLDRQQLEYVQQVEADLRKRVLEILEPTVGRDNLRATVTAEVDFNQVETTSEAFKPNQTPNDAAVRTSQNSEAAGGAAAPPTGVPGAASNQPGAAAGLASPAASAPPLQAAQAGGNSSMRREQRTQYEVDRTVAVRRQAVGTIRRVSAAVLVNQRTTTDPKGKPVTAPLQPEEIEKIESLVQQAIGFTKDRGDSIKVVNMAFHAETPPKPEELPFWRQPWLAELLRIGAVPAALVAVAAMLVFSVVRPALRRVEPPAAEIAAAPADEAAAEESEAAAEEPALLESSAGEDQLQNARTLAKQNPAAVANILRDWVNGSDA